MPHLLLMFYCRQVSKPDPRISRFLFNTTGPFNVVSMECNM
ncbi:10565_t:CDS:2, partial [Racocetra persica]